MRLYSWGQPSNGQCTRQMKKTAQERTWVYTSFKGDRGRAARVKGKGETCCDLRRGDGDTDKKTGGRVEGVKIHWE